MYRTIDFTSLVFFVCFQYMGHYIRVRKSSWLSMIKTKIDIISPREYHPPSILWKSIVLYIVPYVVMLSKVFWMSDVINQGFPPPLKEKNPVV
jgi:hypothetical protein